MNTKTTFYDLPIRHCRPDAAGSVAITLDVPVAWRNHFDFVSGQFITLQMTLNGQTHRRNYSLCSTPHDLHTHGVIEIGVRSVRGGVVSNALVSGDLPATLAIMPPDGRFVVRKARAIHRVGFAAGSGITPILSIMRHTLTTQPDAKFTLVYGNRNMASVMFNEALQDLKDVYQDRLTLIHILSKQDQASDLLEGRIDQPKIHALINALLPAASMDEVFICGPQPMIEATIQALTEAGVRSDRLYHERFTSPDFETLSPQAQIEAVRPQPPTQGIMQLTVVLDGKEHHLPMHAHQPILDVALAAGLDVPYSCKGGVCCTCRAKVLDGQAKMHKNFTLEDWEMKQGFVLSCQAYSLSEHLKVSYDER